MNLIDLEELIQAIPKQDEDLIPFYRGQQDRLVREINEELAASGLSPMNKKDLIRAYHSQQEGAK